MPKKMRSYRLEEESIKQLEWIAEYYSKNNDVFNHKVPVTTVIESLIQKEYDRLSSKEG